MIPLSVLDLSPIIEGGSPGQSLRASADLAKAAERLGWSTERPDYTDLDARLDVSRVGDVPARLQRLVDLATAAVSRGGPVVLGGSSLGAYVSAIASLQVPTRALFLMVPPLGMGPMPALDAAQVPLSVVHAWHDELIPAAGVIEWARARSARLLVLDDSHRLAAHVDATARAFAELLESLPA